MSRKKFKRRKVESISPKLFPWSFVQVPTNTGVSGNASGIMVLQKANPEAIKP
jgi:hypothetical protein